MKQKSPEYIEFVDHSAAAGWMGEHTKFPPAMTCIKAIGWVVKETSKWLCIAGAAEEDLSDSTTRQYIIKSCIRKRKKVKL